MTHKQSSISTNTVYKYNLATRIFHWIGALLIVSAWMLQNQEMMDMHKAVGVSILIWTLLRIINRFVSKSPPPISTSKWQTAISHLVHLALYIVMIAMPISGILMTMYGGRAINMFGLFKIPTLVTPNRDLSGLFDKIHGDIIWIGLIALIIAHISAALYHQFVIKDNLITRMK